MNCSKQRRYHICVIVMVLPYLLVNIGGLSFTSDMIIVTFTVVVLLVS